ncbi:hypothetical protein TUBRATIS_10470 [Tubulinosema ratisbonensis]|uniref:Uncharacterized protein n=1 Tax=Tubulinosema ratisbonensis TaxID=291195 RepID=A0A437AMX3_9MICR|nr:hypothetical protein TUBRATIS_10470 [Tubulinosema ratisbonensis]
MNKSFPLFDILPHKNLIFVCGGGGNTIYGKSNGIIAFDTNLIELSRYPTQEPIIQLHKYSFTKNSSLFLIGKLCDSFILLKFKSFSFFLIKKFDFCVQDILFKKNIYFLKNEKEIHCIELNKVINDKIVVEENYIKKREKEDRERSVLEINDQLSESDELIINDSKLLNDDSIVIESSKKYFKLFYDSSIKLFFSHEKIRKLIKNKNKLIYITNNKLVTLFNKNVTNITLISKLSCLSNKGNVVGTGDGRIYFDNKYYKVSDYPISGVCKVKDFIYYCTVLGDIGKVRVSKECNWLIYFFILFLFILLI